MIIIYVIFTKLSILLDFTAGDEEVIINVIEREVKKIVIMRAIVKIIK